MRNHIFNILLAVVVLAGCAAPAPAPAQPRDESIPSAPTTLITTTPEGCKVYRIQIEIGLIRYLAVCGADRHIAFTD